MVDQRVVPLGSGCRVVPPQPREPRHSSEDYSDVAEILRSARRQGGARAAARDDVINRCLPLAENLARRFAGRGEPHDDLVQVARVGLVNAVDRFDPDKGADFLSFAVPTMLGGLRRHFRDTGWATRVPRRMQELHLRMNSAIAETAQELGRTPTYRELAERLEVSVDDVREAARAGNGYRARSIDQPVGDDERSTPVDRIGETDPGFELVEEFASLRPAVERLDERERTVLALRFYRSMTQTEIAAELGISQMHVSRILSRALGRLRSHVAE
ncbi:SigB/SigF/SigG family RNA polymerase sigma factor [Tsukamurella tyrosinosolvens]|uniref:SigB/SigF/SigG family RNA polymerase sigma factor n=1 Tax=Tsukamurella tyrosinosolvens TaxID=57704 RepID=UPI0009ED1CE0|nr:SigB/SigF/SigG family RNA polymerase sigma factor [Tsukamurella tyrosinosolvens]